MRKILTVLLAFLLTGTLVLFCMSFLAQQAIAPAMGEEPASVDDGTIREQMQMVRERVTEIAELYGFSPEPVIGIIDEDTLRDLNRQASSWWSSLLRDGKTGEEPEWKTDELERVLAADPSVQEEDQARMDELTVDAAGQIRRSILRMVLPLRQQVIRLGLQKALKYIDIPNLSVFFMGVPWALLAACVLLAGLIALIQKRGSRTALQYTGAAIGAAALVVICIAALYLTADILPMIREASQSLAAQYRHVLTGTLVRGAALTAMMIASCALCIGFSRKDGRKA